MSSEPSPFLDIPDPLGETATAGETRVPPELGARLAHLPSPDRDRVVRRRWLALGAALAWGTLQAVALGIRADLAALPLTYVLAWLCTPLLLGAVALAAAASSGNSGLGVRVAIAATLAIAAPTAVGLLAIALPEPAGSLQAPSFWKSMLTCLDFTLAGALAPLVFAVLALRNAFAAGARWRGALIGGSAGLLAATAMNVHCPIVDPMHMLLGHALPVALAALLGALVAHRFMRA